ncbi:MAG TPA: RNA 2',3'-cyclic phosphodiesterase [Dehalococcoidia bacterium]|nr:RNA 2',3'-cyclic phosphodiesterase [Dehalococcoidia bacterium]
MAAREGLWRLFVALELPPPVLEALASVQAALKAQGLEGLRWVRPQGIHLTLKFLGETPSSRLDELLRALEEAAAGTGPLRLSLAGLGTFAGRRGPRVLWVGLQGDLQRLAGLQRRVEENMSRLRFPREERPFSPHLTLARVPDQDSARVAVPLERAVRAVKVPPVTMSLSEVSLMRSHLLPSGAVYERVAAFPLD